MYPPSHATATCYTPAKANGVARQTRQDPSGAGERALAGVHAISPEQGAKDWLNPDLRQEARVQDITAEQISKAWRDAVWQVTDHNLSLATRLTLARRAARH
jgi:hypothetical protein